MGYDANVHITLKNGKTFDLRERGERKQTLYGDAQTACANEYGGHQSEEPGDFVARHQQAAAKRQSKFISRHFSA